jgi:transcriptional regulator with XRE-family HTH domain
MGSVLDFPQGDPQDLMVGARLKRWRQVRQLSLEELAVKLKITPETLRRIEAGHDHLDSVAMGAATTALSLPLWALASDTPTD